MPTKPRRTSQDVIFILMWAATILQAGFTLWELLCLTPVGLLLFGRFCNPLIYAVPDMSQFYLILMIAYAGRNELVRWIAGPPDHMFWDASMIPAEGLPVRIRSGYLAVALWMALLIPSLILQMQEKIPVLPHELVRICIRVFAVFSFSALSRVVHELLGRPILFRFKPDPEILLLEAHPCLRHPVARGIYRHALADGWVTARSCSAAFSLSRTAVMHHLKKMMEEGLLVMEGKRRNAYYRIINNK